MMCRRAKGVHIGVPLQAFAGGRIIRMGYLLVLCLTLTAAGCTIQRTVLVNDRGEEMTCEISGWGAFPALVSSNKQNECIAEAEKRGYRVKESTDKSPSP